MMMAFPISFSPLLLPYLFQEGQQLPNVLCDTEGNSKPPYYHFAK